MDHRGADPAIIDRLAGGSVLKPPTIGCGHHVPLSQGPEVIPAAELQIRVDPAINGPQQPRRFPWVP